MQQSAAAFDGSYLENSVVIIIPEAERQQEQGVNYC